MEDIFTESPRLKVKPSPIKQIESDDSGESDGHILDGPYVDEPGHH